MRKAIQRRVYSVLTTRWGILFVLGCIVLTLNSTFHLFEWIGTPRLQNKFVDNIGGRSYEEQLCTNGIDIVYTWVNGSDPRQIKGLHLLL